MAVRVGFGLFGLLSTRNLLILGRHHAHGTHQAPYLWYTVGTRGLATTSRNHAPTPLCLRASSKFLVGDSIPFSPIAFPSPLV